MQWKSGKLVNVEDLQFQCARILHETLLLSVLMYGSETMLWKQKERSRVRAIQMDNLRGLLRIRRMDRVPNARIRVEMKGLMEAFSGGSAMGKEWRGIGLPREST